MREITYLEPTLIECKTIRWERHSAISSGKHKSRKDAKRWQKYDPDPTFRSYLTENHLATEPELNQIDEQSRKLIDEVVDFAQQSPHTLESRLTEDIFV